MHFQKLLANCLNVFFNPRRANPRAWLHLLGMNIELWNKFFNDETKLMTDERC